MYVPILGARERESVRACVSDHRSECVGARVFVSKDSV